MTYVTDPIGDLLARMRNAQKAGHATCDVPASKLKKQLLELMKKEGLISDVEERGDAPKLSLHITFNSERPSLTMARVSKPGRRAYSGAADLKPVLNGFGMAVLTTSQGLMTDSQAREKKVGGEILCTIS